MRAHARARRARSLTAVAEQKKTAATGEKPEPVRTHLRDMIIVPEMIGSVIGVYNGKTFNQVEIKARCGPKRDRAPSRCWRQHAARRCWRRSRARAAP